MQKVAEGHETLVKVEVLPELIAAVADQVDPLKYWPLPCPPTVAHREVEKHDTEFREKSAMVGSLRFKTPPASLKFCWKFHWLDPPEVEICP